MFKQLLQLFKPFIMPACRAYWFIVRPETAGALIVLTNNGEMLLLTHTYRYGWGLPGGGLKRGETPEEAVRREVFEEIGIALSAATPLGSFLSTDDYHRNTVYAFAAALEKRDISTENFEIESAQWFLPENLPPLGPVTKKVVELYKNSIYRKEI
ncbi:MAG TPA: NUDIX domain-containing protein [Candidatus Paceibacterota bacterium]|jgi:8-oxo-dGTP pyrophosphatase MutT (NUDIX family)|nr:NUDIX domain-containing protein [Candidatus Paceibacterota bacterium]